MASADFSADRLNIEEFILEIEQWPAIWDPTNDEYNNRNAKKNVWESIVERFVPNFSELSTGEKNSIANAYQRKWKSLRDSYTRERSKQRKESKSGAAKYRKRYIFFDQLRFLEAAMKSAENSLEMTDEEENGEESGRMEKVKDSAKTVGDQRKVRGRTKRSREDQDEEMSKFRKAKHSRQQLEEKNDDKLFLLSMHNDLRSLPDHLKIQVKCQMMSILSLAKQAASTVPHFSSASASSAYPHQPPPMTYTKQSPSQSSLQHHPTFSQPSSYPQHQVVEKFEPHNDFGFYTTIKSSAETDSITSDIVTD